MKNRLHLYDDNNDDDNNNNKKKKKKMNDKKNNGRTPLYSENKTNNTLI